MTTKPDDIPQWAWDEAEGVEIDLINTRTSEEGIGTIARAILKAKNDAYEEAANIMAIDATNATSDAAEIALYVSADKIRDLKHETEV